MFRSVLLFHFIFIGFCLSGQHIVVEDIIVSGNRQSKERIILRELDFVVGDTILFQDLSARFDKNKNQILSTGLFNQANINLRNYNGEDPSADITIELEENWYLFPVPIFELADRNFNVWWEEQNKSLERVNYGLRLSHYNFTGNRDRLKIQAHLGYIRKIELVYQYPYLTKDNKLGVGGSIFYSDNKEIGYVTIGNKTQFQKAEDERILLKRFRIGPEIKFAPSIYQLHSLRVEFHQNTIDEFVASSLNDQYFQDGATNFRMFYFEYEYNIDYRKYRLYPKSGELAFINIKKEGIGLFNDIDNLSITLGGEKYWPLSKKLVLGHRLKAKTNLLRNPVAFANNTGLGWDRDIVSGYELYVMDGPDFVINKNRLTYQLFEKNVNLFKLLPSQFEKVNLAIYLRANLDLAIVNENRFVQTNTLNNRWIYGYGPAVDFILFNNFLFSFEYSFNDIGESGLFFHNSIAF